METLNKEVAAVKDWYQAKREEFVSDAKFLARQQKGVEWKTEWLKKREVK